MSLKNKFVNSVANSAAIVGIALTSLASPALAKGGAGCGCDGSSGPTGNSGNGGNAAEAPKCGAQFVKNAGNHAIYTAYSTDVKEPEGNQTTFAIKSDPKFTSKLGKLGDTASGQDTVQTYLSAAEAKSLHFTRLTPAKEETLRECAIRAITTQIYDGQSLFSRGYRVIEIKTGPEANTVLKPR